MENQMNKKTKLLTIGQFAAMHEDFMKDRSGNSVYTPTEYVYPADYGFIGNPNN